MKLGVHSVQKDPLSGTISRWLSDDYASSTLAGRGPRYTKEELLVVQDTLRTASKLSLPEKAVIPESIQANDQHVAEQTSTAEVPTTGWIWIGENTLPPFPLLQKPDIKTKLGNGEIAQDDVLIPIDIAKQHGIRAGDFCEAEANSTATNSPPSQFKLVTLGWEERMESLKKSLSIEYSDSSGETRGPFEKDRIMQWWKYGYFPEDLKIRPYDTDTFAELHLLIAAWLCNEVHWYVLRDNIVQPHTVGRDTLLHWFETEQLLLEDRLFPANCKGASRSIPALYVLVHWLPFSDMWSVNDDASVESMSVAEVFQMWSEKPLTERRLLLAKPESWTSLYYIPVETLMRSYGLIA